MHIDVSNKIIVITGSSRGIGRELTRGFACEKATVVINYNKSKKEAEDLYNELKNKHANCILIKADVTNSKDVEQFYKEVISTYKKVDVLINNAGICDDNLIHLMSSDKWRNVIDVNLTGAFLCSKEFTKSMIAQKHGTVINIGSIKGQEGCAGQVNYSASKAGLTGLTKALAKELGDYGISVNVVYPGFIPTDLNRNYSNKKSISESRSLLKNITSSMQDLVNFVIYLSSDNLLGASGREFYLDSRL